MPSAIKLCDLAAAAYTAKPSWAREDVSATLSFVGGDAVIAFRGTVVTSPEDWARDLDAWPTWRRGCGFVHRGFMTGAELLIDEIAGEAAGRDVTLTGHSRGGALAICTGALLTAKGIQVRQIVTFGAPRVGLWRLRRALRHISLRQYWAAGDVVPDVPWPYQHAHTPTILGAPELDPVAAHDVNRYRALIAARHI